MKIEVKGLKNIVRALGYTNASLAEEYGCSETYISNMISGNKKNNNLLDYLRRKYPDFDRRSYTRRNNTGRRRR